MDEIDGPDFAISTGTPSAATLETDCSTQTADRHPGKEPWSPMGEKLDDSRCAICLSIPVADKTVVLPCRHDCFCFGCIVFWFSRINESRCPVCRAKVLELVHEIQSVDCFTYIKPLPSAGDEQGFLKLLQTSKQPKAVQWRRYVYANALECVNYLPYDASLKDSQNADSHIPEASSKQTSVKYLPDDASSMDSPKDSSKQTSRALSSVPMESTQTWKTLLSSTRVRDFARRDLQVLMPGDLYDDWVLQVALRGLNAGTGQAARELSGLLGHDTALLFERQVRSFARSGLGIATWDAQAHFSA
ncbi:MAG: hypothetical protein SGCHY_001529 [Lobulomycetales sp.]